MVEQMKKSHFEIRELTLENANIVEVRIECSTCLIQIHLPALTDRTSSFQKSSHKETGLG